MAENEHPDLNPANPPLPAEQPSLPPVERHKKNKTLIVLGVIVLLCLVFGVFLFSSQRHSESVVEEVSQQKELQQQFFLRIDAPQGSTSAINGELLVKGQTSPNTVVMIYSDNDEASIDSDETGGFEETIVVGEKGGLVRVTAFSEDGEELSETVNISASNEISMKKSDVLGISTLAKAPATKENNGNKNSEKTEVAKDNSSKTKENSLLMVENSISEDKKSQKKSTNPIELKKVVSKEVKTFQENKSLTRKPEKIGGAKLKDILLLESTGSALPKDKAKLKKMEASQASAASVLKRHAVSGVVTANEGGVISIAHQIHRERTTTIYVNQLTTVAMKGNENAAVSDILVGMRISAVGIPSEEGLLATRIHIIPGLAKGVFLKNPVATDSGTGLVTPSPVSSISATPMATQTPSSSPSSTPIPTL